MAVFRQALHTGTTLQMVSVDDIAVAVMFGNPDMFIGATLELAGDELTFPQVAETYRKVTGRPTGPFHGATN